MSKREFKYTDPSGSKQTDIEIYSSDLDYYAKLVRMKARFYLVQSTEEQSWRNGELDLTDKLLQVDSTYKGVPVKGTSWYDDLITYRAELRDYAYTTSDIRPIRPVWFTA